MPWSVSGSMGYPASCIAMRHTHIVDQRMHEDNTQQPCGGTMTHAIVARLGIKQILADPPPPLPATPGCGDRSEGRGFPHARHCLRSFSGGPSKPLFGCTPSWLARKKGELLPMEWQSRVCRHVELLCVGKLVKDVGLDHEADFGVRSVKRPAVNAMDEESASSRVREGFAASNHFLRCHNPHAGCSSSQRGEAHNTSHRSFALGLANSTLSASSVETLKKTVL